MAVNFAKLPEMVRKQYVDISVLRAVPQSDLTGTSARSHAVVGTTEARGWFPRARVSCYVFTPFQNSSGKYQFQ
jgi:hypothetical protein